MGNGSFHSDVRQARSAVGSTRSSTRAFDYSTQATRGRHSGVHPDLNIKDKVREARDSADNPNSMPIGVCMDLTSSRGKDARAIYEQVPHLMGVLTSTGIVPHPAIAWGGIGDAEYDKAPLQFSQFESDRRIDTELNKIWMEEGGGGNGMESYELLAYYLARFTRLDEVEKRGGKGYAFFLGDEAPYPVVSRDLVRSFIGGPELAADIPTPDIFAELQRSYHPFLIFPRTTMAQRKADIDTEIRQRLEKAGGRFKEVSIRASLIWDTRDDLDLHVVTPSGQEIYYGSKRSSCGGELDVDRNVNGEDPKPVENTRWPKGMAPRGRYRVFVRNYRRHSSSSSAEIPFRVELDIEGEIQSFEGKIAPHASGPESDVEAFSFHYTPGENQKSDAHEAYQDDVVLGKWGECIPASNILRVQDAASSVEVMIGAMALQSGKMSLEQVLASMRDRSVSAERIDDVRTALTPFASAGVFTRVDAGAFA